MKVLLSERIFALALEEPPMGHSWRQLSTKAAAWKLMPNAVLALLAEDEPLVRMVLADMLADAGLAVIEAANAAEAVRTLEDRPGITVLMTDVQMPGDMDGIDLAHEVACRWPEITVIVCSGQSRPAGQDLPPGTKFLGKPLHPAVIEDTLRDLQIIG